VKKGPREPTSDLRERMLTKKEIRISSEEPEEEHQEIHNVVQKLRKEGYWRLSPDEKKEKIVEVLGDEKLTALQIAAKLDVFGGALSKILYAMEGKGYD